MKKKKLTDDEKAIKMNEQRFGLIIMATNILDTENGVSDNIKSAICATLINLMETSFIPGDDDILKDLINNSIDKFCAYVEEKEGVENYRSGIERKIKQAKKIINKLKSTLEKEAIERERRIKEGNDILKGICLN